MHKLFRYFDTFPARDSGRQPLFAFVPKRLVVFFHFLQSLQPLCNSETVKLIYVFVFIKSSWILYQRFDSR
ncbi:hypothetical protein MTBLM1_10315 [Rhodospirillaceae bacterium LM-1]|nr:hypothetical protein MTBLM1_10315 [Rhodospirillaceae bacterium LM-1]